MDSRLNLLSILATAAAIHLARTHRLLVKVQTATSGDHSLYYVRIAALDSTRIDRRCCVVVGLAGRNCAIRVNRRSTER